MGPSWGTRETLEWPLREGARGHSWGVTGWTPGEDLDLTQDTPSRGKYACLSYPKSDRESTWDSGDKVDSGPVFAISERTRQDLI